MLPQRKVRAINQKYSKKEDQGTRLFILSKIFEKILNTENFFNQGHLIIEQQ